MATRLSLENQNEKLLDELEGSKCENHRLRGILKALCLNNGGAVDIPIDYLETYCADAACAIVASPKKNHVRVQVSGPTPADAVAPHVEQPAAPPPMILGADGRPIGDMAPRLRVVGAQERVTADGRIQMEHAGFVADVVDELPPMG
jgi:hypothetical protein